MSENGLRKLFRINKIKMFMSVSICVQYNISSMCCVGRKKNHRKKVTIIFFHIYYTRESHSVYNYFCFFFDVFFFVFFYLFVCVFFCFVFVLIFIKDLD